MQNKPHGVLSLPVIVGAVVLVIGFLSVVFTKETFGRDLEFIEQ